MIRAPARSRRRLRPFLAGALLLSGLALAAGWALLEAAPGRIRAALAARGCEVGALARTGLGMEAADLTCPGLEVAGARWDLPSRALVASGVRFDPAAWAASRPRGGSGPGGAASPWVRSVRVEGLEVRAGSIVLARDLSGSIAPIDLAGPGVRVLEEAPGRVRVEVERELAGPPIQGPVRGVVRFDGASGTVDLEVAAGAGGWSVTHPLLGPAPLEGLAARVEARGRPFGPLDLAGSVAVAGIRATWSCVEEPGTGAVRLRVDLPDTPLADLLAALGPLVPEARRAEVAGDAGGSLDWVLGQPPRSAIRLGTLRVEGALPAGVTLDRGRFSWPCRTEDGEWSVCTTGEGTASWTPLASLPPHVGHAVLAAEDAGFHRHAGYDPASIQAALEADLKAREVVRGGSTLTQQLAKNLFLSGEQTLPRKARELLLAVELDRTLGKARVLELYLNVVEWGPGLHGLKAACDRYFLKAPSRISPLEAAFLATLLPGPRGGYRRWYLEGSPNRARIAHVLDNMVQAGWLRPDEAAAWRDAPLRLVPPPADARPPAPDRTGAGGDVPTGAVPTRR